MNSDELIKEVLKAVVGFAIPVILKSILPRTAPRTTVPVVAWCVAGFVGGAIGGLASGILGITGLGAGGFGNWAIFGASLGFFQWLALRGFHAEDSQSRLGTWFILASVIGWALFMVGGPWGWVVAGIAVGGLQYFSLADFKGAFLWIIVNPIAWLFAGWVGMAVGTPLLSINPVLAWLVGWGVVGLVGAFLLLIPLILLQVSDHTLHHSPA